MHNLDTKMKSETNAIIFYAKGLLVSRMCAKLLQCTYININNWYHVGVIVSIFGFESVLIGMECAQMPIRW